MRMRTGTSDRVRPFDVQNLTDGVLPTWRHGRAWWGHWRCEWCVLYHPRLGISFEKGGYNDNEIQVHLSLLLFTVYLSRAFARMFAHRELSASWFDGSIMLELWTSDDDYDSRRPWYRNTVFLHVREWFTGRPTYARERGEPVPCLVPMPEGSYRATARPETATWTYRFGFTQVRHSWTLDIPGGIPFEGKGENSWDCGPDGLFGCGGATLEKAIGHAVASVLEYRRRRGETAETKGRVVYARPEPKPERKPEEAS